MMQSLRVMFVMAAVPAVASAADAQASPIPAWREGLPAMIAAWIIFGIVAAVLALVVFPRLAKGLEARENKIREEINSAELARKQAKDALAMYERNLADARAEAQRMLEKTRAQQQTLADELRAKADAELAQMKERARRDIEIAKRAAIEEIFREGAKRATDIAATILQREVTVQDQQRLIDDALRELETLKS